MPELSSILRVAAAASRLAALSLLTAAVFSTPAAAQGDNGFLRGPGKVDWGFAYTKESYDEFWVGPSKTSSQAVGKVERVTYSLNAAYGITDDVDMVLNGAYVEAQSDGIGGSPDESDFQDAAVAVKWRLAGQETEAGGFSFLVAPGVKFPIENYEEDDFTALGDDQIDIRGRIIGQLTLDNGAYFAVESGYDWRLDDPEDEIPLNVSVGYTFAEILTLTPFYSRVWSRGGVDIGQGPFPAVREETIVLGLAAYWRVREGLGITGTYRETLDGMNTGDADAFSVGMVFAL